MLRMLSIPVRRRASGEIRRQAHVGLAREIAQVELPGETGPFQWMRYVRDRLHDHKAIGATHQVEQKEAC